MSSSNHAFTKLLADRLDELGKNSEEFAHQLGVEMTTVRSWEQGLTIPTDTDVEPVAHALSLPRSLVREALRRSFEPLDDVGPDSRPDGGPASNEETAPGTIEEPVTPESPPLLLPIEVPAPATAAMARVAGLVKTPFRALREGLDRRRWTARAPTLHHSYLEDPRQLLTYRVRAVMTAGGVLALVLVLRWALAGFGDALSQLWESMAGAL